MPTLLQKISHFLFDHNIALEKRMNILFIATGSIASLLGLVICLAASVSTVGIITVLFIFAATATFISIAKYFHHEEIGRWAVVIGIMVALPITWLSAGGVESGVNLWFAYELFYFTFALRGKKLAWVLFAAAILDSSVYLVSLLYPKCVLVFTNINDAYISTWGSTVVVTMLLVITTILQKNLYNDERKKLEDSYIEQARLKLEAEHANKAKGDFLASMSHEIRTPINAILGLDEMILRGGTPEEIKAYAKNIKQSGNILHSLINDILDFSKIENGKMELVPTEYKTISAISDNITMISPKINQKNLTLHTEIAEELPSALFGDDMRLRQILTNLLTNAVKYTHKGSVTFKVSCTIEKPFVTIHFAIKDTGIGIRENDIHHLTESFHRLDEVRNRGTEGTGLGLAITGRLLQLMGSELKVKSTYGEGSEFSFDVKQKIIDPTPIGNIQKSIEEWKNTIDIFYESFTAPEAKILVVDDNQLNLIVVKGLLKNSRIQIDMAQSGKECLQMVQKNCYDIIFMDHMMPEMDGVEVVVQMKALANNKSARAKIIALTANVMNGAREMFLANGFDSFLAKPVRGDQLEKTLLEYLPKEKIVLNKVQDTIEPIVDFEKGRSFSLNDANLYRKMIQVMIDEGYEKQLQKYFDVCDWKNYQIKAHTLKSNLANIGADQTSALAKELEYAARDGDTEFIKKRHSALLAEYQKVVDIIKDY